VSEGQTWSSEDTRLLVSKSFFAPARSSICLLSLRSALTAAAFSEAERIVFAAEGLFLAHDFPFYCGIRVHWSRNAMNTPTVSQMKGLVDTEQGLLDRQIFFSQD
jgi:hypothetical protein